MEALRRDLKKLNPPPQTDDLIFVTHNKTPYKQTNIRRELHEAL